MSGQRLNIVSLCRLLPTPENPSQGIFVQKRLDAMAQFADVFAIQPVPYFPLLRPLGEWVREPSRQVARIPMFYLPGLLKSLDAAWLARAVVAQVQALHNRRRIDMLDAHWGYPEAVACESIAAQLSIPYTVTLRGHEVDYLGDERFRPRLLSAFDNAERCICVSGSLAQLLDQHGIAPGKIDVVRNAVDKEAFSPGSKCEARAALGLPPDTPIVLSVAQVIEGKRVLDLIAAYHAVAAEHPGARLIVVGALDSDPAYFKRVSQEIRARGLEGNVTFAGRVEPERLPDYYRAADVFCLMTEREGCCNAVLESLASGTPVVTTPAGDNTVFVADGLNGRIVPIGDWRAAAGAIVEILAGDPDPESVSATLAADSWTQVGKRVVCIMTACLQRRSSADA